MDFLNFLNSLNRPENKNLLESIKKGYIILEAMYNTDKIKQIVREDYAPYKDSGLELFYIKGGDWGDEVAIHLMKISDNPDLEILDKRAQGYANQFGLKINKIENREDRAVIHLDRVMLGNWG